jgi:UDP-glucose 4-epimerase
MRILITGAAGFLGAHLVEHFLKEGHDVIGVDNMSGGSSENWEEAVSWAKKNHPYRLKENCWLYTEDCTDFKTMKELIQEVSPDIVYHLACLPHEGLSVFSPHLVTNSVYNASVSVFSAAIATGVKRIVFASSMSRYGHPKRDAAGTLLFWEEMEPNPVDPYGIAKVAAEETLKCLCETHGVEYVIAVPHNIIGTRQNYTDPHRNVASIMMNRLKQGKDVIIYGDGTQTRCFSPISDNIDCLSRMANLADKTLVGEVINIGPDQGAITINKLARKIYDIAGREYSPIFYPDRPREVKHAVCSSDKARDLLGYKENQSLDDCLKEMWDAIPQDGRPFVYEDKPLEIINEQTPQTWVHKLI